MQERYRIERKIIEKKINGAIIQKLFESCAYVEKIKKKGRQFFEKEFWSR